MCIFEVPQTVAEALKTHGESITITCISSDEKTRDRKV